MPCLYYSVPIAHSFHPVFIHLLQVMNLIPFFFIGAVLLFMHKLTDICTCSEYSVFFFLKNNTIDILWSSLFSLDNIILELLPTIS